jgi:hypothetical protein
MYTSPKIIASFRTDDILAEVYGGHRGFGNEARQILDDGSAD